VAATAAKSSATAILVIAPEPSEWLGPVLRACGSRAAVRVFAPWALPSSIAALGRRVGFVRRRDGRGLPGARGRVWFTAAELLGRAWARGKTAPTLANRVRMRAVVDRLAALEVARGPAPAVVLAPTLGARHTFAAASKRGAACLLLEDMPDFDQLVDGLDALARAQPQARFLRNHRPAARAHARQRAERWQADAVAVRGHAGWCRIGASKPRVGIPFEAGPLPHHGGDVVCFAGPPLARAGSTMLPALLDAMPELKLRVLPGPCSEPPSLLEHPRVQVGRGLDGACAVLAPGPLESHPASVVDALRRGVPVVGTKASTGQLDPSSVLTAEADDIPAMVSALRRAVRGEAPPPIAWHADTSLAAWIADQYSATSSVTA